MNKSRWNTAQKIEAKEWQRWGLESRQFSRSYWDWELEHLGTNTSALEELVGEGKILEVGSCPFGMIHYFDDSATLLGLEPLAGNLLEMGFEPQNVKWIQAVGENIPLVSECVDIVICFNVLDHCFSPANLLAEIYRILKMDGLFLLNVNGIPEYLSPIKPLASQHVETTVDDRIVGIDLPFLLLHDIDVFITVPVAKVHVMIEVTLAFKNQWRCIGDTMRIKHHPEFSPKIVAINKLLNPQIALIEPSF